MQTFHLYECHGFLPTTCSYISWTINASFDLGEFPFMLEVCRKGFSCASDPFLFE